MLVRVYVGFALIMLLGAGIVGRTAYIQTYKGAYYRKMADSLTIFYQTVHADRGNIYASDGGLLATSLPIFDLYIDFAADGLTKELLRKNIDTATLMLAELFPNKTQAQYKKEFKYAFEKRRRYYPLHRNVSYDDLVHLKKFPLFKLGRNKSGLIEEAKEVREHPFGNLALRTLGIDENLDGEYSSGLEYKYQNQLQGVQGKKLMQKIGAGVVRPLDSKEEIIPQPGHDIYTTIDISIQDVAQDALRENLIHYQADHGCVIVMETKTGKIRAIANLGRLDSANYYEAVNYAVADATEPGSTFKLATVASLMEDGAVNENTKVDCGNGEAHFYNTTIKDHEVPENPIMTVKRAIEVSSNVAVAKLAFNKYGHNAKGFYNHLEAFGFTKPIDIELQGVPKPTLAQPKNWSGVSAAFIAYGYEIRVTPMHTLQFYNAIANGGNLVKPTLIEKVTHFAQTKDSFQLHETKILSEKTVAQLRDILESVVENGTAKNLKTDYLKIAGKTGTAKIAQGSGGYKKAVYQASFCGYFPVDDPQYSMIVVVNSPS
ncbi:MAG TPA: penicillin-binding protein 2, partial [Chitinophagales bacterium]